MMHHEIAKNNIVMFCWIPSYIEIALILEPSDMLIPHTDFRANIIEYIKKNGMKMSTIIHKFNLW